MRPACGEAVPRLTPKTFPDVRRETRDMSTTTLNDLQKYLRKYLLFSNLCRCLRKRRFDPFSVRFWKSWIWTNTPFMTFHDSL